MGSDSKIQGEDKNRIVGHPDESYGNAIGSVSENMGMNSVVTGKGREVIGHPNMSYWSNWNTEESRNKPLEIVTDGVKKGASDAQILFLSGSVVVGKTLYDLFGGDPTSLQKTQKWLDDCQLEAQKRKPLELKEIYVKGDPEKTMQNVTRYMYQELGNQLVKVPAYFFLGKLESIAQLTGVSTGGHDRTASCRFSKGNGGKPCRRIGDVRCAAWPAERDALANQGCDQIQGTQGSHGLCGIDGFQCRCA